jgi:hypothetical protein
MVKLASIFSAALVGVAAAASNCTNPEVRKSWYVSFFCSHVERKDTREPPQPLAATDVWARHDISNTQRAAYLKANQCIFKSPPKQGRMPWAKTRWDEFVGLHQIMALQIHSTGNFLPYHRYFLNILKSLLAECGYTDSLP